MMMITCRESGGAFGVREAAMEEQYFRRLVYFTILLDIIAK